MARLSGQLGVTWDRNMRLLGWLALGLLATLGIGSIAAVATRGSSVVELPAGFWSVLRFTILQAALSSALSVACAVPLARALARRNFVGRNLLVAALGAPFLLPSLVAVMGVLAIYGRSGSIQTFLVWVGMPTFNIYGLSGIVLTHVFFNLPLVTRLILQGWSDIPGVQFRLSAQLGLRAGDIFRVLEWPMLKRIVPGALLLVFLLCSTSFAVVLTMGGGPKSTTLEVAIYQALRFDFDLAAAATLAVMQVLVCSVALASVALTQGNVAFGKTRFAVQERWDAKSNRHILADLSCMVLAVLFLLPPILAVCTRGLLPIFSGLPAGVWQAALRSVCVAFSASAITLIIGLATANLLDELRGANSRFGKVLGVIGFLPIAISPFVLGTGLFILINAIADPFALALPLTTIINASFCMPLALSALLPAFAKARERNFRLAQALNLQGWTRFRIAIWPEIRRPALFSAAIAAALSMGDFGTVALFAPPDGGTLPLLMQRLMASYQMDEAAGVAVLLVALSFGLFWLIDRGGRFGNQI